MLSFLLVFSKTYRTLIYNGDVDGCVPYIGDEVCVFACMCVHVCVLCVCMCVHVCVLHVCMCVYMCACMCACVHVLYCVCACVCMCVYVQ